LTQAKSGTTPKLSKKERRKRKEAERKAAEAAQTSTESTTTAAKVAPALAEVEGELPVIDETTVESLTDEQRTEYAERLKRAGNSAYGDKAYNRAIDLYSKAILCKKDPVFYSNRAACYSALGEWEKVVDDTTTALNLDRLYVKALNRRSNAYEKVKQYREALEGYTASCIIDGFKNKSSADSVERLLKVVAEEEGRKMMASKELRLPSHTFVGNYLQSFRAKARPAGLEDSVELDEATGKGQLQYGLRSQERKTGEGYEQAHLAFEKAIELGDLGEYEALAYNMRGTFRCLLGKREEAMEDLTKSIELDPTMTQSYIKRASMNLELGRWRVIPMAAISVVCC
jgi:import receptor subunit TOM70